MTALETTVRKLITALTKEECFDSAGLPEKKEAVHKVFDVPFLNIFMMDLRTNTFSYVNTRVAKLVGIEAGFLTEEMVYTVGLILDPMSFQRVLSELERFRQGALHPNTGVLTLLCQENPDHQTFCSDLSALVGRSEKGENTFHAHFFCEMEAMQLVNAYAAFDLSEMTGRQLETLDHLLQGRSYQDIADVMNISYKTVEKHVHAVYEITSCQNQAALIAACNTI